MFEGLVASIFNKWLGKYVKDLDTEHLNVGIFSGEVRLNNLNLKPEALFELELPIEVKYGVIGVINIIIPWTSLSSQAIVINVEDVLILCAPIGSVEFSAEKERRLLRALKKKILDDLEGENFLGCGSGSLFDGILTALTNNVQILIRKIHVRYEDEFCGKCIACGLCIESLSMETTNSKWKPSARPAGSPTVYQLAKLEAASVYFNAESDGAKVMDENWRQDLKMALQIFRIKGKSFDFVIKPFSAKMKAIVSRSPEARVPKLLVDLVVHDIVWNLSRSQLYSILEVLHKFHQIHLRREFLSFRPNCDVHGNASTWWKYFYEAVLRQRIRPYQWKNIQEHRSRYQEYKKLYRKVVLNPGDTELRLDLARAEDNLSLSSIIIAREHGKLEIKNEDPDRIEIISSEEKWWTLQQSHVIKFQVRSEKPRGIWAQLSPSEKQTLSELRKSDVETSPEKAKKYIEHKVNLTIHHFCGSLFVRGTEIASISLSQFLGNFETRPAAQAFKISARAENLALEGASIDQGLVPLVNVVPATDNSSSNFLCIEFEKNPLAVDADYGIMINLEQLEVLYHEHAFSQFLNFFQGVEITQNFLKGNVLHLWDEMKKLKSLIESRQLRVDINMCLKAPHFVIAESGSFQKSGSVTVVGLGKWTLHTDLQPPLALDDVTQMELEERLYDRLYINLDGFQVLFSDSGDKWRESLELNESEHHIISKVRGQIVSSSSIKPNYKLLPKSKLNIILYNLKVNLSDMKIVMLLNFFEGLPLPSTNTVSVITVALETDFKNDIVKPDVELDLNYIKNLIVSSELSRQRTPDHSEIMEPNSGSLAGDWSSVDMSDEDVELWAKTVDLPGFDDNISPNNVITSLLRVMLGEIIFVLSRSSNALNRPYLMARITKFQLDTAFMNYGPAIQATLGGIQLIDKFCIGPSGEYLEIVSTQSDVDFISLLYRKVRSNCPDFKSHFHSVEQSLVLDIGVLNLIIHREAILTFTKYLQYLRQKIAHREILTLAWNANYFKLLLKKFDTGESPPIPSGAVKFSYSTHLTEFRLKLCDTELEFLELKVKGFESDCMFKANERMVLRAYLSHISLDDLSEFTTYPKIISVEEEKVLDVKYVRHSPRFYNKDLGSVKDDDVQTDGSFKLNLERIHVVVTFKMMVDMQHFIEPLISIGAIWQMVGFLRRNVSSRLDRLRGWNTRLRLSLVFHFPVLLIPQKSISPNLFVLDLGELSVENFFKKIPGCDTREETANVVDNILFKLESASLSRAAMTLTGRLEIRENVLEPIRAKVDVKRFVGGPKVIFKSSENGSKSREIPLFEIHGNLEPVNISFGQNDLFTFLSVWNDNFGDKKFLETSWWWKGLSPVDGRTPTENEDLFIRKLQVFLSHGDASRIDTVARFVVDSVTIDLYNDMGEVLSSPVRDVNHGLCRLTLSEGCLFMEKFYDTSMEIKMSLQSCLLEDIRTDPSVVVKRVFQSHQVNSSKIDDTISISTPPFVDVTFKQTSTGDRCIDVLVEKTKLNLTVSFVAALAKFAMDSVPFATNDGGFINHGYVGDLGQQRRVSDAFKCLRPPLSTDNTSGYYSSGMSCAADEQCGLSVSVQFRKPEVMILSSRQRNSSAIVFRCELLADWSKHPGRDALVITLAGFQAWSKFHPDPTSAKSKASVLLNQCDVEVARTVTNSDDELKITVLASPIEFKLSVVTVAIIAEIIQEIRSLIGTDDGKKSNHPPPFVYDLEDLWSPKKIESYCDADICAAATEHLLPQQPSFSVGRPAESLTIRVPKIEIILDVPQGIHGRRPLFLTKCSFNLTAYDWSSSINLRGELQIQAAYFNEEISVWEPFIEPCNSEANGRKPWEFVFQVFQGKSFPISPHVNLRKDHSDDKERKVSNHTDEPEESETSGDESDQGMTFLRRQNFDGGKSMKSRNFSLNCGDSSESESEDGALEKLTKAVGRLFAGENSDGEGSESVETSATEDEEVEEREVETEEETGSNGSTNRERAVFLKKHFDSVDSGLETEAVERLAIHVLLHSKDRLELTVTPHSVKVLQEISNAFSGSPTLPMADLDEGVSVKNSLGLGTVVTLLTKTDSAENPVLVAHFDRSDSPPSSPNSFASNRSSTSDLDGLDKSSPEGKLSPVFQYPEESVAELYGKMTKNRFLIQIPGFKDLKVVAPKINCIKVHALQPKKNQTKYHVVLTTTNQSGCRKYVVRSPLQVRNCTSHAMEIHYKKKSVEVLGEKIIGESTNPFDDFIRLAVIEPDDILNVPLFVAYHCKLHVAPALASIYQVSENGISWQEMISDVGMGKDLLCPSKQENDPTAFSIRAHCETNSKSSNRHRSLPNCHIRLLPPLTVFNYLPYALEIKLIQIKYEVRIEAGDKMDMYFLDLRKPQKITIEIPNYFGIRWTGSFNLMSDNEEKVLNMMAEQETDGGNKQLSLSLTINKNPTVSVRVYSSYWIINKTELPLQIRGSLVDRVHEWTGEGPLLFGFRKLRRRCVRVRAFSSSWSSAFSLDTPECSGLVICKDRERKRHYRMLVQSRLSRICPKFTKIISFLPNFIVTNFSKKHLRFMEDNERADLWLDIAPGQCLPFWPETDSMKMFVKFRDSKHISQHFSITIPHTTVLRMDKGCGLTVEVTGTVDQPFFVWFRNYKPGDAPVRIDNQCEDLFLKFHQKDSGQVVLLSPYQSLLYTWDDPSKERTLLWNVYNNKGKDFCVPFWKDGFGEEKVSFHVVCRSQLISNDSSGSNIGGGSKRLNSKSTFTETNGNSSSDDDSEGQTEKPQLTKKTRRDKIIVYWASYLNDRQRVLLLTQDERLAKRVKKSLDAERSHLELFVSMSGLGVSLVNRNAEEVPRELAYFSLTDSAARWEVTVGHKWKTVALELASWLEDRYKQGLTKAQIKDYIHIDFDKMQMTKPFFGELRRKHRPAVWIQYRRSKHMSLFHFQLHRFQVDNQVQDAEMPTVFCPVPIPADSSKSQSSIRPAIEIAYLKKYSESCRDVFKFAKLVVQEHRIQIEKNWMMEMSHFCRLWCGKENSSAKIRQDIALIHAPISALSAKSANDEKKKNMFEYLHCSPIKVQIEFSSQTDQDCGENHCSPLVEYFLFTLAPPFAQAKSITVRLLCFEIIGQVCNRNRVWHQGIEHYKSQFWQQWHVLVMGTNVLTNPYSQVLDFSDESHPLFYEPYLENAGVPEEFSDGISVGALGLLGHEIGGRMGAETFFAALLGTALDAVIRPDESKKCDNSRETETIPESIVRSFSDFCPLALSGVVARQHASNGPLQGPENFFKGPGKGLWDITMKSAGGVFDCAAMIADGIKRAMEMGEDVICRVRSPRHVNSLLGLRPYSSYEARGVALLKILCKGLYSDDLYWAHAALTPESKTILLVTLQHVFLIGKYKYWGPYELIWALRMDDLMAVPTIEDEKLMFSVRQEDNSSGVWNEEKSATSNDKQLLQWLKNQIETALVFSMEGKPCL